MSFSKFARMNLGPSPLLRAFHEAMTKSFDITEMWTDTRQSSSMGEVHRCFYTLKESNRTVAFVCGHRGKYDVQGLHIWESDKIDVDPSFSIDFGGVLSRDLVEAVMPIIARPRTGNVDLTITETLDDVLQQLDEVTFGDVAGVAKQWAKQKYQRTMHAGKHTRAGHTENDETREHTKRLRDSLRNHHDVEDYEVDHDKGVLRINYKTGPSYEIPHHNIPRHKDIIQRAMNVTKKKVWVVPKKEETKTESVVWDRGMLFEDVAPTTRSVHVAVHPGFGTLGRIE